MIITENITINEVNFVKTYSDQNVMIRGGYPEGLYSEAVDPIGNVRTYVETDIPIPEEEEDENMFEEELNGE